MIDVSAKIVRIRASDRAEADQIAADMAAGILTESEGTARLASLAVEVPVDFLDRLRDSLDGDVLDPEYPPDLLEDQLREAGATPEKVAEGVAAIQDLVRATGSVPENVMPPARPVIYGGVNAVAQGALIERASIDGDVPEMRTGPLPEGGRPAVPVVTDALDPIALGSQLRIASADVAETISEAVRDHRRSLLAMEDTALVVAGDLLPAPPTGVPGYRAGEVPAAVSVPSPTGSYLATVSSREGRELVYSVVTTTQGRKSAAAPMSVAVARRLSEKTGREVLIGTPSSITASHRWTVTSFGADDLSDRFNPLETALATFVARLASDVMDGKVEVVNVRPIGAPSDRTYGWEVVGGKT